MSVCEYYRVCDEAVFFFSPFFSLVWLGIERSGRDVLQRGREGEGEGSIGSWKRAPLSFSAKEIGETREGSGEGEVKGEIWRENNVELLTETRISSVGFFLLEWERICGIGCREKKKNFNTQHNKVKNQIRIKSNPPPPKKKSRSPLLLQTYINHMVFF